MKRNIVAIVLVLYLSMDACIGQQQQQLSKLASTSDGRALCAVDSPSYTVSVTDIGPDIIPVGLPDTIRCAAHCTARYPGCTAFNYWNDNMRCDMFNYQPNVYNITADCQLYAVSDIL